VHPPTIDFPGMGHVDAEWKAFLEERADAALGRAQDILRREWAICDAETVVVARASVGHGLRDAAEATDANMIVLGPGAGGHDSHLGLGSVAHSLLHGSPTAIALAPEGYRETAPNDIRRLVVGFQDTPESAVAVETARAMARPRDVDVHLLTVVVRMTRITGSRLGRDPERQVMDTLVEQEGRAQADYVKRIGAPISGTVVQGDTAGRAMSRFDWQDSDVFVVASSSLGALTKVFMGDLTHKLLRACTVPAVVLPRGYEPDNAAP
jgi:nucleotide-binding universal stress UspA family protein